ncbi:MAG: uracil-DNA glycosylase [Deltaproteobacteria bacterium]|nr:uracil-DNA glycosylase [Myxococcales bacterium]MDP3214701.1 uracil-DNA glycosylase [Deltaproteobacteria bacterium]
MDPSPRDELLQLIRDLGGQLAWQRDAGLLELPSQGALPAAAPPPAVAPPPAAATVVAAPTPVAPPMASPVASPVAPPAPAVISVLPAPVLVAAAPPGAVAAIAEVAVTAGAVLDRVGALRVIQDEVRGCRACKLAPTRTQTVFARGNPDARLCFIGEGPGADEDRTGLPFVGLAGQLLDRIIAAMRLTEEQVYIANIVKCRPPNNRVPDHEEMSACTPFLLRQLEVVKPEVIVALGKTATGFLLDSKGSMGSMRGRWHSWKGVPVMPTWHPSYVLRVRDDPKSTARAEVWTDMKLVLERLGLPVPAPRG